jgi:hypothetical protein
MNIVKQWIEITFVLILVYLILSHGTAFTGSINAISSAYIGAGKMLQGRG